jgi:hypothetical protein
MAYIGTSQNLQPVCAVSILILNATIRAMAEIVFPREGQGFRAEVKIGDDIHLVLMATHTAVGPAVGIYDAKAKKWWREHQWAEDIDDAKAKAEATARTWYRHVGRKEPFPALQWTETG